MHCVQALWGPVAPQAATTALAVDDTGHRACFTGAEDGSIISWQDNTCSSSPSTGSSVGSLQPVALFQHHQHPVVSMLAGLTDADGASYLVSLDAEGWVCLWELSSYSCINSQRAAPLPPAATPHILHMPDPDHICIVIPAAPGQQQQQQVQQQALPHSQQFQASASAHAPMMLVLHWHSLTLVAAPLVAPLGVLLHTTSSNQIHQQNDWVDDIAAVVCLETAPALAPTAADTVVLAVTSSGYMFAGSVSGTRLLQAWPHPAAPGGSTAPLLQGCIKSNSSGSSSSGGGYGSSTAVHHELQLLLVQHNCWRLLVSSSFSNSTGMATHWQQVALQQYAGDLALQCSMPSPSAVVQVQPDAQPAWQQSPHKVRFTGDEPCSSDCSTGTDVSDFGVLVDGCASPGPCAARRQGSCDDMQQEPEFLSVVDNRATAETSSVCATPAEAVGGRHMRRRGRRSPATGAVMQQRLLGGMIAIQQQQQQQQHSGYNLTSSEQQMPGSCVYITVWSSSGVQEVWRVNREQHVEPQQQQQQKQWRTTQQHAQPQQAELLLLLQLQPWPSVMQPGVQQQQQQPGCQAIRVIGAQGHRQQHGYALVVQLQNSLGIRDSSWQQGLAYQQQHGTGLLRQLQRPHQDWHVHFCELLPHKHTHHHHQHHQQHCQDMQQQQQCGQQDSECVRLQHSHGSMKAPWSRQHLYYGSMSASSSGDQQYVGEWASAATSQTMMKQQQQQQESYMEQDEATGCSSLPSRRKRPADDAPAACAHAGCTDLQDLSADEPAKVVGGRPKHPRLETESCQRPVDAVQLSFAIQGLQQQKVTHMLLLASGSPSLYQLAIILQSGTILFYDLATYCIPGAAWHPDCCHVATGHSGPITATLQLHFKCPPGDLVVAAAHTAVRASLGADNDSRGGQQPDAASNSPAASSINQQQGSLSGGADGGPAAPSSGIGPADGGIVPLLLSGGSDGSVHAWDLRVQHLGQSWMTTHPHTAPVERFVLPPSLCRLPWSSCVLSVCAAGVVALSCLATGTTHRTFHGWGLGPPAQLAWSTTRGVVAAGGHDADGLWHVAVWDSYSGQLDRRLSGPPAHMCMAALTHELTTSIKQHKREQQQQQQQAAAKCSSHESGSRPSSTRVSWDAAAAVQSHLAAARAPMFTAQPAEASPDGSAAAGSAAGGGCVMSSRMELIDLSSSAGPIRLLQCPRSDLLLIDVNVQQLLSELEGYTRQQRRPHQYQHKHKQQQDSQRPSSTDGNSSVTALSHRGSLDLSVVGSSSSITDQGSTAPMLGQPRGVAPAPLPTAAAGPPAPGSTGLSRAGSAVSQTQLLLDAVAAAAGGGEASHHLRVNVQQQLAPLQCRQAPAAAAVCHALQALCLLHRWGVDQEVDHQLIQLLLELGFSSAAALLPAAARDGERLVQKGHLSPHSSSGSSRVQSPAGPDSPLQAVAAASVGPNTQADCYSHDVKQQHQSAMADMLLNAPATACSLQSRCPCLTQEVLISATGALTLGLPTQQHQAQQAAGSASVSTARSQLGVRPPLGLLLYASSTLLSSRLLCVVAMGKWLMSGVASATACNAASGVITLYAAGLVESMRDADTAEATAAAHSSEQQRCSSTAGMTAGRAPPIADGAVAVDGWMNSAVAVSQQISGIKQQQVQRPARANSNDVLVDLPLIASTSLAATGVLAESAKLLLAALLHPAPRGTYPVPALLSADSSQQQGGSAVFIAPGSAAAASCWPPAVLQFSLLHHQHTHQPQQQSLVMSDVQSWLPLLVLSAAAAVPHAGQVPEELVAAVSAGLLEVLLGAAPAAPSCTAAAWLCDVLRSGRWHCWRPYLGKPAYLLQRLCHLVERLHPNNTGGHTAAALLNSTSPTPAAAAVTIHTDGSRRTPTEAVHASGASYNFSLLAQEPSAVADPAAVLQHHNNQHGQQQQQQQHHHNEGGLFINSSMLHTSASGASSSSPRVSSSSSSPLPPLSPPAAAAGGGDTASVSVFRYRYPVLGYISAGSSSTQQITSSSLVQAQTPPIVKQQSVHLGQQPHSPQQQPSTGGVLMSVSRAEVVTWLRSVVDMFAGLALVEPAALLNELSHKLADPSCDSSTSLPLLMSGLARLCKHTPQRHVLLPHLGFTAALAVQALDPGRPALRSSMMQAVSRLVKELTGRFPQVCCHTGSLQLAVGSSRSLGNKLKGQDKEGAGSSSSNDGCSGGGGVMRWSVYAGGARSLVIPGELLTAAAVAVFDMNGGTKRKVLLLPVLLPLQQAAQASARPMQQVPLQIAAHKGHLGTHSSSGSSSMSTLMRPEHCRPTGISVAPPGQHSQLPGGIPGLWSAAEGLEPEGAMDQQHQQQLWGCSSSSLSSTAGGDTGDVEAEFVHGISASHHPGIIRYSSAGSSGDSGDGSRSMLVSNTVTRAEVAMMQHWFGREQGTATAAGLADSEGPLYSPGLTSSQTWGVWLCHERRSSYYPTPSAAGQPLLTDEDVASGVAAVAFNPAGDAVAAFIESCCCLVVWRLESSWTQKFSSLGSSKPSTHHPCAYTPVPPAALLQRAIKGDGVGQLGQGQSFQQQQRGPHEQDSVNAQAAAMGQCQSGHSTSSSPKTDPHPQQHQLAPACVRLGASDVCCWQLKWVMPGVVDLLHEGRLCASMEVHL